MKKVFKIALLIMVAGLAYNCGELPLNCDINDETCLMQYENMDSDMIDESTTINTKSKGVLDGEVGGSAILNDPQLKRAINNSSFYIIRSTEGEVGGS